jgi:CotH kinase protein
MSVQQQRALDSLYALDNVLTIRITMSHGDWDAVRTEEPAGGRCNFNWTGGSRFTWRKAASVEISGTRFPARTTFSDVGVKKKSFCGSFRNEKPCLHIDFGRFSEANIAGIESLIGSRYVTLNNSVQDRSYTRQPLGYTLLALAGLPHSRCNFARVFVNGTLVGEGVNDVNAPGVYVNAEPIMKRYIERNFNGNMKGNLYELESGDDLVKDRLRFIATESLSKFEDQADLKLAIAHIAAHGLSGAAQVLDLDQFIKLYAMEFYLKHWDGYAGNTNNTYLYNDVDAVTAPGLGNVKFKMIPWGIDQTLKPDRSFRMRNEGLVAKLVRDDATRRAQLINQIRIFRETVFGRGVQEATLQPMIDKIEKLLVGLGVPDVVSQIATVRQQLRLAESAGYLCAGLPATSAVHVLESETGECLHASNTEGLPAAMTNPPNFEVYHRPLPGNDDKADLWFVNDLGRGKSISSQAYGRVLHASNTFATGQGHKLLYTSPANNTDHAEEFSIVPVDSDEFAFSGYFELTSIRTGLSATYGSDATPAGRPRIHQEPDGSKLYLY